MTSGNKNIGIAGFGVEGKAVFEYLKYEGKIFIFDELIHDIGDIKAELSNSLVIPEYIDVLYKSPGIPNKKIKLNSEKTKVTTLMDDVLRLVGKRSVGITGSKGKSTTSSLINHILKENGFDSILFGNIGVADMNLVKNAKKDSIFVIELSSYQCENIQHSPHIAVFLNLYQEHLTHHGSFEKYKNAKLNIAKFQSESDVFVNGSGIETDFKGKLTIPDLSRRFETKLLGDHNQKNCAIAFCVAKEFNITEEKILESIKNFEPLKMRMENIGTFNGITFYDDSLATVPEATLASIRAIGKVDTIILGGEDRNVPLDEFSKELAKTSISTFIIFPDNGDRMVEAVGDKKIINASSMEEAVKAAYENTESGGSVLLSNAAKSHSMFKNYLDKSEQYIEWIKKLSN